LIVFNSGISIFSDAVKRRALQELHEREIVNV